MKSFGNQKKRREKSEEVYINGKINFFMFKSKHCILLFCVGFNVPNYINLKKNANFLKLHSFSSVSLVSYFCIGWILALNSLQLYNRTFTVYPPPFPPRRRRPIPTRFSVLMSRVAVWGKFSKKAGFHTLYGGQFTIPTQLIILSYLSILSHRRSTTVSLETNPLLS